MNDPKALPTLPPVGRRVGPYSHPGLPETLNPKPFRFRFTVVYRLWFDGDPNATEGFGHVEPEP